MKIFDGISPSIMKSIFNSAAKDSILNGQKELNYSRLVLEIFLEKRQSGYNLNDAIDFLRVNMVSQREISKVLNTSLRTVREAYKEKKDNGD